MMSYLGFSQQDAQYTQYMYNTININPAYAGSAGTLAVFALHRTQWVGLDGAPVSNTIALNVPIADTKLGVGLSFINDKLGPTIENVFSGDISYTIDTNDYYKMSFGIKGSLNSFTLDPGKLDPQFQADPLFASGKSVFSPNVGAGLYYHSDYTYIGISVPNFINTIRKNEDISANKFSVNKERMNFYLIGGHVWDLTDDLKFKPAGLVKLISGAPLQADLSANFMYKERFVLGGAYRWSAAFSLMAGFQVNNRLYLGYGYDLETTKLRNFNSGSHEFFIRYEFVGDTYRTASPRFF